MRLRNLTPADLPRLLELNNAAVPAVPTTTREELQALMSRCDVALGVEEGVRDAPSGGSGGAGAGSVDALHGFLLGLAPGSDYDSDNYRFFSDRSSDFLYVDRIVIDERSRGRRMGQLLYARVFELARQGGRAEVTCEVNIDPPNPGSLAFHGRLGFAEVGRQSTKGGTVTVSLLAAPAAPQAPGA